MHDHELSPEGRVVMLSGANRGIGRALAERLHAEGYQLSLGARDPTTLGPLLEAMSGERACGHEFEARSAASAKRWAAGTLRRFGRIDVLINNAGIMHPFSLREDDETALDEMWEVNVKGPLRLVRAALAALEASGCGRVINIVSLSGKRVKSDAIGGYAMSKHAAAALTHTVRQAGWARGVRATSVCPGYVATDMTAEVSEIAPARMIPPAAVALLVAALLRLPNNACVSELPVNCLLEPEY